MDASAVSLVVLWFCLGTLYLANQSRFRRARRRRRTVRPYTGRHRAGYWSP